MAKMTKDCWADFPHFEPSEFRCGCGHETQHIAMDCKLLRILEAVRDRYGATTITSGYRCAKYNSSLKGSIKGSYHTKGKACDFYVSKCSTESGRREIMAFLKKQNGYKYTYCNLGNDHPNMGNVIHIEVL